jgi:signal transduction histidine kinase
MDALTNPLKPSPTGSSSGPSSGSSSGDIAGLLGPGIVSLGPGGAVRFADERALELLGCEDGFELERLWAELGPRLESAGLSWNGAGGATRWAVLDLPVQQADPEPAAEAANALALQASPSASPRRLAFDLRRDPEGGGVLLVQDAGTLAGLETDLRLTSQMRSVSQISPAVAHDLRAPINAMVFNIEILKEMIASGRATDPNNRDKLLRYTTVLKEELSRLHRGLETFLAYISPRSDKNETFDLRELAEELAALLVAPARKQQVQVKAELPEQPAMAEGNRYLLRQALLHVALAALAGVPKQGMLYVRLEPANGRARLRVYGAAGPDSPAAPETPPAPAVPEAPAPGFDLRFSPGGSVAQLWVARAILAAHGGEARVSGPAGDAEAGGPRAYEVELTLLGNSSIEEGVR